MIRPLSILVLLAATAGCDALTDAATRIAYDIEAGEGRLGRGDGSRHSIQHHTPSTGKTRRLDADDRPRAAQRPRHRPRRALDRKSSRWEREESKASQKTLTAGGAEDAGETQSFGMECRSVIKFV